MFVSLVTPDFNPTETECSLAPALSPVLLGLIDKGVLGNSKLDLARSRQPQSSGTVLTMTLRGGLVPNSDP